MARAPFLAFAALLVSGCALGARDVGHRADARAARPAAAGRAGGADGDEARRRTREEGPRLAAAAVAATFSSEGARIALAGREILVTAAAIGRERLRALPAASPARADGATVRLGRGAGVEEWWTAAAGGLEHGVTLGLRPPGRGPLRLEVEVRGALRPRALSDDAVALVDGASRRVGTYAGLVVTDADERRLPARLAVSSGRIRVTVDDAGARYPLVIDPLVSAEEATLTASDGAVGDAFGSAVAMSADGARVVVGAPLDDNSFVPADGTGGISVYVRTGTSWARETQLLGTQRGGALGHAVAIDATGTRMVMTAYLADLPGPVVDAGTAFVYVRSGATWSYEATLAPTAPAAGDWFGASVAISGDGSRAVVGASQDDTTGGTDSGSARVFVRAGSVWTEEAALIPPGAQPSDSFGDAVALSADGALVLVGSRFDDVGTTSNAGSAHVFVRSGTTWSFQATLLDLEPGTNDFFGGAVALSADGTRALVGAELDDAPEMNVGSATVFARAGATWAAEARLSPRGGEASDLFGYDVALSADGARAVVGAREDGTAIGGVDAGSARVFVRSGSTWAEEAELVASDGEASDFLGRAVAMSADGARVVAGAPSDDTPRGADAGSARIFLLAPAPVGAACGVDAACASGFCTDGVCCSTRCAGGALCQGCSAARTGGPDGTCAPLTATAASATVCRAARDLCDAPEACTAGVAACPADARRPAGAVCRPPAPGLLCDAPEACTGLSDACPPDGAASAGTPCRASAGPCDAIEVCDGAGLGCPEDGVLPADAPCRASRGACDIAELCDGVAVTCPVDTLLPLGSVCRGSAGACDLEEACTGTSPGCPPDAVRDASVTCRPATSGCDLPERCTGASAECPVDLFASAAVVCGAASGEPCDAPDHCSGTSADCVPTFLAGVVCRAATGACDVAEACSGASAACPPDGLVAAGLSCRPTTEPSCDPAETCDGASAACPDDVTRCEPDAGVPAAIDGGAAVDGGLAPAVGGCACRLGGRAAPALGACATACVVALAIFRRPRARRTRR